MYISGFKKKKHIFLRGGLAAAILVLFFVVLVGSNNKVNAEEQPPYAGGEWIALGVSGYELYITDISDYSFETRAGVLFVKKNGLVLRGRQSQDHETLASVEFDEGIQNLTLRDLDMQGNFHIETSSDFTLNVEGEVRITPPTHLSGGMEPDNGAINFTNANANLVIDCRQSAALNIDAPNHAVYSRGGCIIQGKGKIDMKSGKLSDRTRMGDTVFCENDIVIQNAANVGLEASGGAALLSTGGAVKVSHSTINIRDAISIAEGEDVVLEDVVMIDAYDTDGNPLVDVAKMEYNGRCCIGVNEEVAATGAFVPVDVTVDEQCFLYYVLRDDLAGRGAYGAGAYIFGRKPGGAPNMTVPESIAGNNVVSLEVSGDSAMSDVNLDAAASYLCRAVLTDNPNLGQVSMHSYNSLQMLDLSRNPQLDAISVSGMENLKIFNCYQSGVSNLALTGNFSRLEELNCMGNKLTALSINNCPSLEVLDCRENYLYDTAELERWGTQQGHSLILGTQNEIPLSTVYDTNGSGIAVIARFGFDVEPVFTAASLDETSKEYRGLRHDGTVVAAAVFGLSGGRYGTSHLSIPVTGDDGQTARLYAYGEDGNVIEQSVTTAQGQAVFELPEGYMFLAEITQSGKEPGGTPQGSGTESTLPGENTHKTSVKTGDNSALPALIITLAAAFTAVCAILAGWRFRR